MSKEQIIDAFRQYATQGGLLTRWSEKNDLSYQPWTKYDGNQAGFNLLSDDRVVISVYWPSLGYRGACGFHAQDNGFPSWSIGEDKSLNSSRFSEHDGLFDLNGRPQKHEPLVVRNVGSLSFLSDILSVASGRELIQTAEPFDHLAVIATADAEYVRKARIGQDRCRAQALTDWEKKCAVSGCMVEDVLDCAHIVPWDDETRRGVRSNFILMRADLHRLFDRQLLRIDPETLAVRILIDDPLYTSYNSKSVVVPSALDEEELKRNLRALYS